MISVHDYLSVRDQARIRIAKNQKKVSYVRFYTALSLMLVSLFTFTASQYGLYTLSQKQHVESVPVVAGVETQTTAQQRTPPDSSIPAPTTVPPTTPSPAPPSPTPIHLPKNSYTVAIIGDSMVDTMGEKLEYLEHALTKKYPETKFTLYNYGHGSQNVIDGLDRIDKAFKYHDRDFKPLTELRPDVLVVASFGYNPLSPFDRDEHWLKLAELISRAKTITKNVYVLAEIAPQVADFGKGPNGVSWPESMRIEQAKKITLQLQNAIGLARSLSVPLIDCFTPSIDEHSKEGNKKYINASDGIHPSIAGHEFMAEKIVNVIEFSQ